MPAEGLEPTHSCEYWILSPARLPFRHAGVLEGAKEYGLRAKAQTLPTRSSGCRLRGGPKISRKIIASRKPDVDLNNVVMSIFASADLEIGCVVISYISAAAVFITGTDSGGGGPSRNTSGGKSGGRVFNVGIGDLIGPTCGSTTGR